jgi:hypothetical protein
MHASHPMGSRYLTLHARDSLHVRPGVFYGKILDAWRVAVGRVPIDGPMPFDKSYHWIYPAFAMSMLSPEAREQILPSITMYIVTADEIIFDLFTGMVIADGRVVDIVTSWDGTLLRMSNIDVEEQKALDPPTAKVRGVRVTPEVKAVYDYLLRLTETGKLEAAEGG